MDEATRDVDVVVVGGGLAGLVAATLVAKAGRSVIVVPGPQPGGRARTVERNGFLLNTGPHALYQRGAAAAHLRALGINPAGAKPASSGAMGLRRSELLPLPFGPVSLARTGLLRGRSRTRLAALLARVPLLDPAELRGRSVSDWLGDEPDDVRALMETLVRTSTYAACPEVFAADAAVAQLALTLRGGVKYLDGGWQVVVDALSAAAVAAGTIMDPSGQALRVDPEGGRVEVTTNTGRVVAHAVIVATGLPGEARRLNAGWVSPLALDALGPAAEASCLDLATHRLPRHTLVFGVGEDTYLSAHAPVARLAPPGAALVTAMAYLRPEDPRSADELRAELNRVRAVAGVADHDIVFDRFLRRVTVAGALPIATAGGLPGRARVDGFGHPSILLAGDWVGAQGLLADAAAASAAAAAGLALRRCERLVA